MDKCTCNSVNLSSVDLKGLPGLSLEPGGGLGVVGNMVIGSVGPGGNVVRRLSSSMGNNGSSVAEDSVDQQLVPMSQQQQSGKEDDQKRKTSFNGSKNDGDDEEEEEEEEEEEMSPFHKPELLTCISEENLFENNIEVVADCLEFVCSEGGGGADEGAADGSSSEQQKRRQELLSGGGTSYSEPDLSRICVECNGDCSASSDNDDDAGEEINSHSLQLPMQPQVPTSPPKVATHILLVPNSAAAAASSSSQGSNASGLIRNKTWHHFADRIVGGFSDRRHSQKQQEQKQQERLPVIAEVTSFV